ncbi:MAG: hypothetical protein HYX65_09805 [Gemmatimonadetes bacterium]|nr:hypothetical protein [Gemmatimonadota bacterium]
MRFGDRQEVRLSIVVNARCFASTSDSLQHTWAEVRKAARAAARDQSLDFATLAVATNQDIETGLVLLRRLAPVDEISTGRSWMNHDALDLIASGESESLVVPQLVVSLRSTAVDSSSIRAAPARVIRRFAGLVELKKAAAYFRDGEFSRDVRTVRLISREPRSRLSDPGRVLR